MFTVNSFFQKNLKNPASSLESCLYADSGRVFSTGDIQLSILSTGIVGIMGLRDSRFLMPSCDALADLGAVQTAGGR
jgi:hypothetical protein